MKSQQCNVLVGNLGFHITDTSNIPGFKIPQIQLEEGFIIKEDLKETESAQLELVIVLYKVQLPWFHFLEMPMTWVNEKMHRKPKLLPGAPVFLREHCTGAMINAIIHFICQWLRWCDWPVHIHVMYSNLMYLLLKLCICLMWSGLFSLTQCPTSWM